MAAPACCNLPAICDVQEIEARMDRGIAYEVAVKQVDAEIAAGTLDPSADETAPRAGTQNQLRHPCACHSSPTPQLRPRAGGGGLCIIGSVRLFPPVQ